MSPANVSLVNAITLIVIGTAGYFLSETPSKTAFIPVVFGVILAALNPGVRKHNKLIAHIAVVATLFILIGLAMPMKGAIGRSDTGAVIRVSLMLLTTLAAMAAFINSFIQARKKREAEEAEAANES